MNKEKILEIGLLSFIVYMSGTFIFITITQIIIGNVRDASKLNPIINIFSLVVGLLGSFFLLIGFDNFIGKLGSGLFLVNKVFGEFVTIEMTAPHLGIFYNSLKNLLTASSLESIIFYVSLALIGIAFYTQGRRGGYFVLLASSLFIIRPFYNLLNVLETPGSSGPSFALNLGSKFGVGFSSSNYDITSAEITIGGVMYNCPYPLLTYIIFETGTIYSHLLDDVIFVIGFLMILKDLISANLLQGSHSN